jgi:protein gp37
MSFRIEWATTRWNPTIGCSPVSAGCKNCWAQAQAVRQINTEAYRGIVVRPGRWTGAARLLPERLAEPLGWRAPQRVAVSLMGDLFHQALPDEAIAAVFAIMALAVQHTFLVLTKRPDRMRRWTSDRYRPGLLCDALTLLRERHPELRLPAFADPPRWPLPNVWLGTSIEQQDVMVPRVLDLLATPATHRWLSLEPLLGSVDLGLQGVIPRDISPRYSPVASRLHLIVAGGESGPGARPCDLGWLRSVVEQCAESEVPCFVKQLGSNVAGRAGETCRCVDSRGADPREWPADLRVQQLPEVSRG